MAEEAFSDTQAAADPFNTEGYEPQFGGGDFGMGETAETEAPSAADAGGDTEVEAVETAEPDVLDVNEFGDRMVTVVVDGEEQRVPLKEAVSGYQRQADYTRKTQELAQARALKQLFDADPRKALQTLAIQFDMDLGQAGRESRPEPSPSEQSGEPVDPELAYLRSQVEELSAWQTEQLMDRTLQGLSQKYGEHYDEQELLIAAQQAGIQHPSQLEDVFRSMMFDKFYAEATAKQQAAASSKEDDAAREKAVQQMQNIVSSGNGVAPGAPVAEPPVINSIDDAVAAAKRQLGLS